MTNQSITTVANHVVAQYSAAGKTLNKAYRATAVRMLDDAKARLVSALDARSIPMIDDNIKSQLVNAQQVLAGYMLKGVQTAHDQANQAIDTIAKRANSSIESMSSTVARVESSFELGNLDAVRTLNAPIVSLVSQLADKMVEGAKAVEARLATVTEEMTEVAVIAKPARAARKG
ncbi:hypothetical protein [Variovorax rhizosphaerae]|uniref:Phasin family protein n=1 Tax=Variovorax rhizosphaerae TaxID=1836200 RepID=A0ABU8WPU2_9BURK